MTDHHIEAAIVVQGYLLEILLGAKVYNQSNPLQMLDLIQLQVRAQIADDLKFQQPVPPELARAIDAAHAAVLDRVAEQLTNQLPPQHNA